MKKSITLALAIALPAAMMAQTAIDAYQLSRSDLRGTARFMSMGGAFGALGGDLSTLNQNPGGIGLYRKSEVGLTVDIDMQSTTATSNTSSSSQSQTKVYLNNIGYVGALRLGMDAMPYFQWGVSYGRVNSFDRYYKGGGAVNGSLTNYIAGYTTAEQWPSSALSGTDANYYAYNAPWMSMLAYNSFMINQPNGSNGYAGLYQNGTTGVNSYDVLEKGYVDEYSVNFGGNIKDVVYWGLGIGVTDIEYSQSTYYTEDFTNALIPYQRNATAAELNNPSLKNQIVDGKIVDGTTTGDGGYGLDSYKRISGTGYNFKLGLIVRPTNSLRFGLAVHTPTYYNLEQTSFATVDYGYGYTDGPAAAYYSGTPEDYVRWKLRTPWRLIASAAAVISNKGLISADYEYRPYQNMATKTSNGFDYTDLNGDIKTYFKAANILRLGGEYRLTNNFSLRAGFAYESTPTTTEVREGKVMVYTSNPDDTGVTPSYTLDNNTYYATCGIGWHIGGFYADAAYVYKHAETEFMPFTPNAYTATPFSSKIEQSSNNIVLSIGYKF